MSETSSTVFSNTPEQRSNLPALQQGALFMAILSFAGCLFVLGGLSYLAMKSAIDLDISRVVEWPKETSAKPKSSPGSTPATNEASQPTSPSTDELRQMIAAAVAKEANQQAAAPIDYHDLALQPYRQQARIENHTAMTQAAAYLAATGMSFFAFALILYARTLQVDGETNADRLARITPGLAAIICATLIFLFAASRAAQSSYPPMMTPMAAPFASNVQ
jgi:Na+-transporting methylmalonyl-CoA/oxaloacetate decarboxylase gamma subunit